jgi:hypothetical protein
MTRGSAVLALAIAGCQPPADLETDPTAAGAGIAITTTVNSTRFVTREHMLAAAEMQISGEPLAEAMGRDLGQYARFLIPTDLYYDMSLQVRWIDLAGFSTGVESYEYSKQPMNGLGLEFGAGTSLAHAPLVNPSHVTGTAATALLTSTVQHFGAAANAMGEYLFAPLTYPVNNRFGNRNPLGTGDPATNTLGWPGLWPTNHVFASFDPTVAPTGSQDLACALASDDDTNPAERFTNADYECDASTLHLVDRAAQIESVITPGADGFSGWKYGLWTLNYLQSMHDHVGNPVSIVDDADLAQVGVPGNTVFGADGTVPGTYLGSSDVEGFQAPMFITEVDNRAEDWLFHLSTADGTTLSGFADLPAALAYDEVAPLRWFPGQIAVTETADGGAFAAPAYSLASADSNLLDVVGLAMSYATFYALTDTNNLDVGGAQSAIVYFDGDPFPADNQLPDGEPTLHDRALAMMRVAMMDLDRMHVDPASGLFVDDVAMTGTTIARGHTVSTTNVAYALIGMRTVLRTLSSQLELYSNNLPDRAVVSSLLDVLPIHRAADPSQTFTARVRELFQIHADLLLDHLTDASGRAWRGWDVTTGAHVDDADLLDSYTAAIRGLFAGYLATGDVRYRDRAIAVFQRVEAVFYDADARIYAVTPAPVDSVEYTPLRFALLQSSLRDVYELVAAHPGGEAIEPLLENRLGRLNKLVLNGWDDRNYDRTVKWPDECTNVVGDLPRGGLQMAERTLTGETGNLHLPGAPIMTTSDREHDCVPEIDDAKLPAALADSVTFTITRP